MDRKLHIYGEFKANLEYAVENNRTVRLVSYSVSDDVEVKLDAIIHLILKKYDRLDLKPLIYTLVKELLINGAKANLKRVFFEEMGFDIHNESDYEKGISEYKAHMTEDMARIHGKLAREKKISVDATFHYNNDGIVVEVVNYTAVTPQEEKRFRKKLGEIMKYDTMIDFYMNNEDHTEGAGLGLAMVTTMMKAEDINANFFRLFSDGDKTTARVEIPLSDDYISVREKETVSAE